MMSVLLWMSLFTEILCQEADQLITVNTNTQMLVDSYGRERFFHGTNVVVKHFPFVPEINGYGPDTFSETDMKILQKLGLNVIRLGMMVPGYVPKRGEYNETYIDVINQIVSKASTYGIYTLLDMHQDVLSPKFCVEGMPDWMINTGDARPFPYPLSSTPYEINPETGYPYLKDCKKREWGDYYFTEAVTKAFQNIYDNVDGLLDELAMFWKKTAEHFRSTKSVIGYELINEPYAGDIYENPKLLIPGVADRLNLERVYDVIQKAIREVDEQHLIYFEGVTWDFFKVGFTKVPGGSQYQNRSVLSYHYYEPPDFSKVLNFAARMNDLKRLKSGGFLTEFFTVGKKFDDMYKIIDLCDQYKQSWIGWMYKPYRCIKDFLACDKEKNHSGGPGESTVFNTTRTYPQAVAGYTNSFHFDRHSNIFSLSYITSKNIESRRTEVYFNREQHYANGYYYTLNNNELVEVTESENGFLLYLDHAENLLDGTKIIFSLMPKK